ncbi:ABC transporter permease [Oceanibacterium hippocampi]|uniref:ABC-2 family transporter protein n=1 Tax=Oceanibacterium hippocampi TaxID=745714 RepID=A0A1Y5R7I6_9PROT|nr:ABC transporter permease [Oceanibacterium hippocampi]SLN10933.1 ABC-2 family transporter protein [Oceanibacterium hippocampi]
MRLTASYFRAGLKELLRNPGYWVPTILFPAMLFSFFGAEMAGGGTLAGQLGTVSFTVYAVVGVSFYQFGVGVAQDRETPWEGYLKTLPTSPRPRIAARLLTAILFALGAAALVIAVSRAVTGTSFSAATLGQLALVLFAGAVPFTLLGIAIGYLTSARASVAVANMLFLPLAFVGGLWLPPQALPDPVAAISPYTPTRELAELAWAVVLGRSPDKTAILGLIGYTLLFGLVAGWAAARDQWTRYG